MKITFESVSKISFTMIYDKPCLIIGESLGDLRLGIQPTYGMTADDMGFYSFAMTINLEGKS